MLDDLLVVVAHAARLALPPKGAKDDTPQRVHLEAAAKRGVQGAIKALEPPVPFPEPLQYLHDWHVELTRGKGVGMMGANPLTYEAVLAWSALMDRHPTPDDVDALFALDRATMDPDAYLT